MHDLLTPDELAAIAEREAKATEGPWVVSPAKDDDDWPRLMWDNPNDPREDLREQPHITDLDDGIYVYDMDFIAHARADIPALLRHIAALEAQIIVLREAEKDHLASAASEQESMYALRENYDSALKCAIRMEGRATRAENENVTLAEQLATKQGVIQNWMNLHDEAVERMDKAEQERDALALLVAELETERDALREECDSLRSACHTLDQAVGNCPGCAEAQADLAAARKELAGLKGGAQ